MKDETKMDAHRLITEVYKRPALWNQRHLSYHNRDVTNRIWMEIAAIFKLPKQVLKTKWKGLRDTFRAEIKKEQVYRKSKYTSNRPAWIHFKTLQFLKEQMLPRPPIWERTNNSRENYVTGGGGGGGDDDVASEDSCGIDVPESASNIGITHVEDQQESWMDMATKDSKRTTGRRISSHYQENLEIFDDLAECSNEKVLGTGAASAAAATTTTSVSPVDSIKETLAPAFNPPPTTTRQHSDSSSRNNNNSCSSSGSICNNQIEETSAVIKLEPADHYENNVDEFAEEINNSVDNSDTMLKKITTEEVMMGESSGDNCVIGSQLAVDPLEVNRFDDNYYFLMSLLPHIRTLPAERRMLLRMQMQQLVYQEVYNKTRSSPSTSLSSHSQQQRP